MLHDTTYAPNIKCMRNKTKIKTKRTNRTSIFVWVFVFYFPNFSANKSVFCVFFSFPGKVHMPFIHSISELFFFPTPERKKNSFFIHSSEFLKKSTKTNLSAKKKIRYLWVSCTEFNGYVIDLWWLLYSLMFVISSFQLATSAWNLHTYIGSSPRVKSKVSNRLIGTTNF